MGYFLMGTVIGFLFGLLALFGFARGAKKVLLNLNGILPDDILNTGGGYTMIVLREYDKAEEFLQREVKKARRKVLKKKRARV